MKTSMMWALVLIAGIILALASAAVNVTPSGLVGAVWYGWPVPWLLQLIVAPQYFPWTANIAGLIFDIIIWSGIVTAIWGAAKAFQK